MENRGAGLSVSGHPSTEKLEPTALGEKWSASGASGSGRIDS